MARVFALLMLVSLLVGCDHVSKGLAQARLAPGAVVPVAGKAFELRYAENRDVAFNLLSSVPEQQRGPLLLAVGALAIAALGVALLRSRPRGVVHTLALASVLAGALGNFIDRVARGYVIDFLHLAHWPVFNVADVYVTLGVGLLLVFGKSRVRGSVASG